MYLCRAALQRFSSVIRPTHRAILHRDVVPRRSMSSVPGGTGENLVYLVLCGGAFAGALTYAYRTVTTDSARFTQRITEIEARPKNEWKPKPWPPKNAEEAEEVAEEAVEPPAEPPVGPPVEPPVEPPAEPPVEPPVEPPAEVSAEEAAPTPVEPVAEVKSEKPDSMVETAPEAVAKAADGVVEADGVAEKTPEKVAAVVHEVEKIVEEVEIAAKELVASALPVVEEATAKSQEAALQEEAVTESANTEA